MLPLQSVPAASLLSQIAAEKERERESAGKSKWKTCYAARGTARQQREGQRGGHAKAGQGRAGQGRLSIGGRVRLATTWRSWPISVQQSELVGASMPGPEEGRESEMSRGCRGGADEELLLLLLLCLFAICVNVYEPQLAS